jgi:hypothetical protein
VLRRFRGRSGAADGTDRTADERAGNGATPATGEAAKRRTRPCPKQAATDGALPGIVGVGATCHRSGKKENGCRIFHCLALAKLP